MKKRICFLLCTMLLALCTALAEETAYDLPLDIDFPNYPADPAGFSEDAYHDESLDVRLESGSLHGV